MFAIQIILPALIFLGAIAASYFWYTSGSNNGNKGGHSELNLEYADAALPFYGIENGCIALKGGDVTIPIEISGFDYASATEAQIAALNQDIADGISAIMQANGAGSDSAGGGGSIFGSSNAGIVINFCGVVDRQDNSDISRSIRQAENSTGETGLAAFALLDGKYLGQDSFGSGGNSSSGSSSEGNDFWSRSYCISITLTKDALAREQQTASDNERAAQAQLERVEQLVQGGYGSGGNVGGSSSKVDRDEDDYGEIMESIISAGGSQVKPTNMWEQLKANLFEGLRELRGENAATKLEIGSNGGIATHSVPATISQILIQVAEMMLDIFARYGIKGTIPDSVQTAHLVAQLCNLPTTDLTLVETEIKFLTAYVQTVISIIKETSTATIPNASQFPTAPIATAANLLSEAELRQKVEARLQTLGWTKPIITAMGRISDIPAGTEGAIDANKSPFMPKSGNPNGQIDVSAFGMAPIEFASGYIKIGIHPAIARAHTRFVASIVQFRRLYSRPTAATRLLGDILESAKRGFYMEGWPRPTYMTTLVSMDWGKSVNMGVFRPLLARTGFSLMVNTQIKPLTVKKTVKKLDRQRNNIELASDVDKDRRSIFERKRQVAAIDQLLEQLAGDEALLNMVGQRITVKANTPAQLKRDARQIASILAGLRLRTIEANFNQANAWYSALPLGRDFISAGFMVGKRTLRNMTSETAACFFPAVIPNLSDPGGVLAGQSDDGGLIRLSDSNLISPHKVVSGMSGSGKTVNELLMAIRQLYSRRKLKVRVIDPQGVADLVVQQCNGSVANVAADGSIRFNFLERNTQGGRPQVFSDVCDVFLTMLSMMQQQSFDETVVKEGLNLLYLHFEQGLSVTRYIVKSLVSRYFDELGFGQNPGLFQLWLNALDPINQFVSQANHIPSTGFVVRVMPHPDDPSMAMAVNYQVRNNPNNKGGKGSAITTSETGVVLEVLHIYSGRGAQLAFNRNYFAGGPKSLVEIPANIYQAITQELRERHLNELEYAAWLAYALTAYLVGPYPRRASLIAHPEATASVQDQSNPNAIKTPDEVAWLYPPRDKEARLRSGMPGTHLLIESGPVWYADEEWEERVYQQYVAQLAKTGLLDGVDVQTRRRIERDCFVGVKRGVPILSDIIPLVACEDFGRNIARNLETYCNDNINGAMFNGHTNANTGDRFFSYNVKNLTDKLRPLRMMQCLELIWREIASNPRGSGNEFIIIIDEFGIVATQSPEAATYVGLLFKRARAFGAKIVVLEQNTGTFNTLAGEFILTNAGEIRIMRQDRDGAKYFADYCYLGYEEELQLTNLGRGEALIFTKEDGRNGKRWVKYGMHPRTLRILSTKPSDVAQFEAERRSSMNISALDQMLEDLLPAKSS